MAPSDLTTHPPAVPNVLVSFPAPHILLVTLNRPAQLNAIPAQQHARLEALWRWYDAEPSLRCAVLTGAGRAFCAGADLKQADGRQGSMRSAAVAAGEGRWTTAGFGGMSNRPGRKPVVAAVNGLCLGGGMEMAINCDMVVAARGAKFGLPEVTRGVVALAGALPRVVRIFGRQRASEMVLTGRMFSAEEMERWGFVNQVVDGEGKVVDDAVRLAEAVAANSPDAVLVSREGMRLGMEAMGPELATEVVEKGLYGRIDGGENMKEGIRSFVERRKAKFVDSKL
jgi:enoyl-CoA hydratase/carnithine racemase